MKFLQSHFIRVRQHLLRSFNALFSMKFSKIYQTKLFFLAIHSECNTDKNLRRRINELEGINVIEYSLFI